MPESNETTLFTTYNSFEADQIIAALKDNNIPAYKREAGAGQYLNILLGVNTTQAIDIIIPEKAEGRAKEILEDIGFLGEN